MVRPGGHTAKGLSEKEVLETILNKKRELEKSLHITVNVVVYCDMYASALLVVLREFSTSHSAQHESRCLLVQPARSLLCRSGQAAC